MNKFMYWTILSFFNSIINGVSETVAQSCSVKKVILKTF